MQATLPAHRVETTIKADGTLTLDQLPFRAGQTVEVIILPYPGCAPAVSQYPLRGTPVRYDDPTGPIAEDEWEASK